MTTNTLQIVIKAPLQEVYDFTVTPPNSTLWIDGVTQESANPWPLRIGTTYTLVNIDGSFFTVKVVAYEYADFIEWVSEDGQYHCRYNYIALGPSTTQLTYREWVDSDEIEAPFEQATLQKLKMLIETYQIPRQQG